jgi:serine/threonine-protein kinase HipA
MRTFAVFLYDIRVGHLVGEAGDRSAFVPDADYLRLPLSPVLGQTFEDDPYGTRGGTAGRLPPFFANLVPEGRMREWLAQSVEVALSDDLGLLGATGADLPGALSIRPSEHVGVPLPLFAHPRVSHLDDAFDATTSLNFRFSMAGVQRKLSVVRVGEGFALPMKGMAGDWILKLESDRFPDLVANEHATMKWAAAAGFDVPECRTASPEILSDGIQSLIRTDHPVYLIRRFDRNGDARVHQEDLAQVVDVYPECKYGRVREHPECLDVDMARLVAVIRAVAGRTGYIKAIRRLALMVATGNSDAHLKNWAFIYPDRIKAELAPLYDQVAICAWEGMEGRWALPWKSNRNRAGRTDERSFATLAEALGEPAEEAVDLARAVRDRLADVWSQAGIDSLYPPAHAEALRRYWRAVPFLRVAASRLG